MADYGLSMYLKCTYLIIDILVLKLSKYIFDAMSYF